MYDKRETYETELTPIVGQICLVCREHKIPCFLVFQVAETERGTCIQGCGEWDGNAGWGLHRSVAEAVMSIYPNGLPQEAKQDGESS